MLRAGVDGLEHRAGVGVADVQVAVVACRGSPGRSAVASTPPRSCQPSLGLPTRSRPVSGSIARRNARPFRLVGIHATAAAPSRLPATAAAGRAARPRGPGVKMHRGGRVEPARLARRLAVGQAEHQVAHVQHAARRASRCRDARPSGASCARRGRRETRSSAIASSRRLGSSTGRPVVEVDMARPVGRARVLCARSSLPSRRSSTKRKPFFGACRITGRLTPSTSRSVSTIGCVAVKSQLSPRRLLVVPASARRSSRRARRPIARYRLSPPPGERSRWL